ncbi:MAG TPA: FAD binding domain-containing protein [Gemmatimonadaceae bacterium]
MIPPEFDYERPSSVEAAVAAVASYGADARVLAGGQSLLPLLKARAIAPKVLVDIGGLDELRRIERDGDSVTIGALATQAEVLESAAIGGRFPRLRAGAPLLGDPVIRNRGTFVGALAFADPAADWTALALVLDARLRVRGATHDRTVPIGEFLLGAFTTTLAPTEVITHVTILLPAGNSTLAYWKVRHPGSGMTLVGAAVLLDREGDSGDGACRVAITGAGPRAVRVTAVEDALRGERLSPEAIEHAADRAADGLELLSDEFASSAYRERLARACVRRALSEARAA